MAPAALAAGAVVYIISLSWYNQTYRNQEKRGTDMMNRIIPWAVVIVILATVLVLAIIVVRSGWQYNGWSHQ